MSVSLTTLSNNPINQFAEIRDRAHFQHILTNENPGIIYIKFGAEWCGPCKQIVPQINHWIKQLPPKKVHIYIIDIDDYLDVYAFLKNKKMVSAIPTILCYYKENTSYVPDDIIMGSDTNKINDFFIRTLVTLPLDITFN
jgi:thiol-disulfide isomerase/thioredoxin